MLQAYDCAGAFGRADPWPAATRSCWQAAAITPYRRATGTSPDPVRRDLAARILALTGQSVAPGTIVSDAGTRKATVALGDAVFQLRRDALVLLRRCGRCGAGRFASPAITDRVSLEYACAGWEPRCAGCSVDHEAGPSVG